MCHPVNGNISDFPMLGCAAPGLMFFYSLQDLTGSELR